jgi:hypothetical protein
MNRMLRSIACGALGVVALAGVARAQEAPPVDANADGSVVKSDAALNPSVNADGQNLSYGDIGPGTVLEVTPVSSGPAPVDTAPPADTAPPVDTTAPVAPAGPAMAVPTATDADADNLPDANEATYGTDPNNQDTDGDHLADGDEINMYGTNPAVFDTDGDGLGDGQEVFGTFTNPLVADSGVAAPAPAADSAPTAAPPVSDAGTAPVTTTAPPAGPVSTSLNPGQVTTYGDGNANASPGTVTMPS